VKESYCCY